MRNALFAVYVVVYLVAVIWPGYDQLGNRIEPYLLGLPFSFAWLVFWLIATFAALLAYHLTGPDRRADRGED